MTWHHLLVTQYAFTTVEGLRQTYVVVVDQGLADSLVCLTSVF